MVEPKATANKSAGSTETALPLSRIRTIMKSSVDTGQITNEVLFLMTKSAELFIQHITKEAYQSSGGNLLKYEHLAKYVQDTDNLEFLLQIVPQKIKVKDFKEIIANQDGSDDTSDSDE